MLRRVVFILAVFMILPGENYKCVACFHNHLLIAEMVNEFSVGYDKYFHIIVMRMVKRGWFCPYMKGIFFFGLKYRVCARFFYAWEYIVVTKFGFCSENRHVFVVYDCVVLFLVHNAYILSFRRNEVKR